MSTVNQVAVSGTIGSNDISSSVVNHQSIAGELGNALNIGGQTSEIEASGSITSEASVVGELTNNRMFRSTLENRMKINGQGRIPIILDKNAIHYGTTEDWNSDLSLIGETGHIYVYSDYRTKVDEHGQTVVYPALKVGDGTSYLVDAPFLISGDDQEWIDHISNHTIHVTATDKSSWNTKVAVEVDEDSENLLFIY